MTAPRQLPRDSLEVLISALRERGYIVIGPVARDGAVVYDEIASASELPTGLRDRQAPGAYRLEQTGSSRAFDVVNGPEREALEACAAGMPPEVESRRLAETSIRSYDPCISCSAHFLRLSIEERAACRTVHPGPGSRA